MERVEKRMLREMLTKLERGWIESDEKHTSVGCPMFDILYKPD